jgi:hypothetical protein
MAQLTDCTSNDFVRWNISLPVIRPYLPLRCFVTFVELVGCDRGVGIDRYANSTFDGVLSRRAERRKARLVRCHI